MQVTHPTRSARSVLRKLGASLLAALTLLSGACAQAAAQSGSYGQINQPMERAEGWQSFVASSPFVLGAGAPSAVDASVTVRDWGGYPSIDGSTVCVPMAMELARQLLGMSESDLTGFVQFSTTHAAYERLIGRKPNPTVTIASENAMLDDQHPIDLFLGTAPSDEELQLAADAGVELVKVPICLDAFVFLVNGQNAVDDLSVEQIRGMYTGAITNWRTVGGADRAILPFRRPKNSGSQTAMETTVMQGVPLSGAVEHYVSDGMADLIRQIGEYNNAADAIGYSYQYYVDALYKFGSVKTLSVDGVAPTPDNLRSGAYPFTVCYCAVYRKGDALAAAFAEWLTGNAAQRAIAQAGYVGM